MLNTLQNIELASEESTILKFEGEGGCELFGGVFGFAFEEDLDGVEFVGGLLLFAQQPVSDELGDLGPAFLTDDATVAFIGSIVAWAR